MIEIFINNLKFLCYNKIKNNIIYYNFSEKI